jgi:predicted Fe-S protein YdhL (DUF1289 family)
VSGRSAGPVRSPCNKICRIEPVSGWCAGCGRTRDEIARWGALSEAGRDATMAALPARMEQLNRYVDL